MTPTQQLNEFLGRFEPQIVRDARAALVRLRKLTPGATELVYDNYRGLVIGFGPTARPSEAALSLAIYADHLSLCFIQNGPRIPDPHKLLLGSGNVARHIKLQSPKDLDDPRILALIAAAKSMAKVPFPTGGARRLIIQSVSDNQVPRRASAKPNSPRLKKKAGRRKVRRPA